MHPFDAWIQHILLPFAQAALTPPFQSMCVSWSNTTAQGLAPSTDVPTYWALCGHGSVSTPVEAPGIHSPEPTEAPSAHQKITLARLGPAFWEGLERHMRAFCAPLEGTPYLYGLVVEPGKSQPVTLDVYLPFKGQSQSGPLPFLSYAHWSGAYATLAALPGENQGVEGAVLRQRHTLHSHLA